MAKAKDRVSRLVTGVHKALYRASGGRLGGRVAGMPVLLLATRGRNSGRTRTTPLTYLADGDRLVLVASNGGDSRHPDWYRNLCAEPVVSVTVGTSARAMTARKASPAEKERLWPMVVARYSGYDRYQRRTTRDIPLVILEPR
jgi:deazaflavin-dependent oxidoreductase (nitroreductase family)